MGCVESADYAIYVRLDDLTNNYDGSYSHVLVISLIGFR